MSYQEKRTILSIVMGVLLLAAYCIYTFGKVTSGAAALTDLKFFAVTMLVFIGIGIAAMIVIQIIFHILLSIAIAVKERERDEKVIEKTVEAAFVEDEMDKLIELKSGRVGFVCFSTGFIAGLVTLIIGWPTGIMLNILFLSMMVGTLAGGFTSLYYYRAGVR